MTAHLIDRALAGEVCEHCMHPPTFKHRERQQEPYRGMWQALCGWEQDTNPDGALTDLRRAIYRITEERPEARAAFAVNTTRYERPLDETTPGMEQAA